MISLVGCFVILGGSLLVRAGIPVDTPPGWTFAEYDERIKSFDPGDVAIEGDSRIGWGVAEKIVSSRLPTGKALNLGWPESGAATTISMLEGRLIGRSGTLVVGFTPAHFYSFSSTPKPTSENVSGSLRWFIPPTPTTLFADLKWLVSGAPRLFWKGRTVDPDGFVTGQLAWTDGRPANLREIQEAGYRSIMQRILADSQNELRRRDKIVQELRIFTEKGWQVILLRPPVDSDIREIEGQLPDDLSMARVGELVGIVTIDHSSDALPTIDGSHLTPESARAFSRRLGDELSELRRGNLRSR